MSTTIFKCRILTTDEEINAVANDWRCLADRIKAPLFTDYDGYAIWRETIGDGNGLHIVTAYEGDRLVGVLPLIVRKKFGLRMLLWACNKLHDYCQSIAETEEARSALWATARASKAYDFAVIRDVKETSSEAQILSPFSKRLDGSLTPFIDLQGLTQETWDKPLSNKLRRDTRQKLARLKKKGAVSFVSVTEDNLSSMISQMVQQKLAWYSRNGKGGVFSHPQIASAFLRIARYAADRKSLNFVCLMCDEKPLSFVFQFIEGKSLQLYCTSYDLEWSNLSPGRLIAEHSVASAISEHFDIFDFMRGDEPYKMTYASGAQALPHFVFSRTPQGFLGALFFCYAFRHKRKMAAYAKTVPSYIQHILLLLFS